MGETIRRKRQMQHLANTLGVDEVGRGCLFGKVVAGAVMLPSAEVLGEDGLWREIRDSKKLSEKKRKKLRDWIVENAVCYGIGECSASEIDEINILQASFRAMTRAIVAAKESLDSKDTLESLDTIDKVYIDGDKFKTCGVILPDDTMIPYECVVNGDNVYLNIAAASILAKCHRDEEIVAGCAENPIWLEYGFDTNKGYGTKKHFDALRNPKLGLLEGHRRTFCHI